MFINTNFLLLKLNKSIFAYVLDFYLFYLFIQRALLLLVQ
jgi:hypothetical protein